MGCKFCYSCHIVFFNQVFTRFNIWNLININDCLIFCFSRLNTYTTTLSSILNPLLYWGIPVISKSIYFPSSQQITGGQLTSAHTSFKDQGCKRFAYFKIWSLMMNPLQKLILPNSRNPNTYWLFSLRNNSSA